MSDESVRRQLKMTDDAITNACGVRPTLMRPPYGSITLRQKRWIHDEFGYRIILWDVDPLDWKRPGAKIVTSRIVTTNATWLDCVVARYSSRNHRSHAGNIERIGSERI